MDMVYLVAPMLNNIVYRAQLQPRQRLYLKQQFHEYLAVTRVRRMEKHPGEFGIVLISHVNPLQIFSAQHRPSKHTETIHDK